MNSEKQAKYSQLFWKLYSENKLFVRWSKNSTIIESKYDLEHELLKVDKTIEIDEFTSNALEIANIAQKMVLEGEILDDSKYRIDAARQLLENNPRLIEEIYVRSTSNVNTFEGLDYEILTKREKGNLKNIIGHSAILRLNASDANRKSKDDCNKHLLIEITRGEAKEIIETLQGIIDDIEYIEDSHLDVCVYQDNL